MCGEPLGVMIQEGLYLSVLDEAATYAIEGDSLTLFDNDGNPRLTFTAAE